MLLRNLINFQYKIAIRSLSSLKMVKPVKVEVSQGVVVGEQRPLPNGQHFNSFQGIPYAVPPLGELRYRSPIPLERFDVPELDCSKERDISHQRDPFLLEEVGSENCLFLNVYAPQSKKNNIPVMVFIHGGGFWFGNGNSEYYYPLELVQQEVIVVTFNYRLGALGFLCLPEAGIYGNAGLKDQRLALQWVHDNISNFGGDPKNVTIFGESAGGASVHLHAYAEHANKLFHKAIMQSGLANMEWVFAANPEYKARRMAQLLGLQNAQSCSAKEVLAFLQSEHTTPTGILQNTLAVMTPDEKRRGLPLIFKPVVEQAESPDSFITQPIRELLAQPNKLKMPTIMGLNGGEGQAMFLNARRKLKQFDADLARFIPRNLPIDLENQTVVKEVEHKMRQFYFNGQSFASNKPEVHDRVVKLLSDYHFTIDFHLAAETQVRLQPEAPLYCYRFNYVGEHNMYKNLFQMQQLYGACHGDELHYLFQMAGDESKWSEDDAMVAKQFAWLWANFAKCGNPTTSEAELKWDPIKKPLSDKDNFEMNYLLMDKEFKMMKNPEMDSVQFWREMYAQYESNKNAPQLDYSRLSAKL